MDDTTAITDDTRFVVPDHVLTRRAAGETVLLDLETEEYFSLEETGSRLWQLIEQKASVAEVIEALLEEYEVEPAVLRDDVIGALDEMCARGLLVANDA